MSEEEIKALLLLLDPIVHAEGDTEWDYGYGGDAYERVTGKAVYLSTWVREHGWGSNMDGYEEVQRLLEEWPTTLLRWREGL